MVEELYPSAVVLQAFKDGEYERVHSLARPFAETGHAEAQTMLGVLFQMGLGVPLNGPEAVAWFTKAADQDYPVAWNNLGTIYLGGLPCVAPDRDRAIAYYQKAHALGFAVFDLNSLNEGSA